MTAASSCAFAELEVTSNYSFLSGASHPAELVTAAAALGLSALGIADRNSLAGVVRAHVAAKQAGLRLLVGARLVPRDGPELLCYPQDRAAYGRLCRLLTLGKRRVEKGDCALWLADIIEQGAGQSLILLPRDDLEDPQQSAYLEALTTAFPGALWIAARALYRGEDDRRLAGLAALAARWHLPLVACGDVAMHHPDRKPLMPAPRAASTSKGWSPTYRQSEGGMPSRSAAMSSPWGSGFGRPPMSSASTRMSTSSRIAWRASILFT